LWCPLHGDLRQGWHRFLSFSSLFSLSFGVNQRITSIGVDAAFDMLAREALHKMLGTNDKTKKPGTGQDNQKVNLQAPPKTTSAAQKKWKFC